MKRLIVLLLTAVAALPFRASATGQAAETLIVGRDTMQLFALPLESADSAVLARLGARLQEIDAPWSTGCWRRYIGVWRLEKGVLWFERVETMEGEPVFTGAELFPESAAGTRVRAAWFSGEVRYGTGKTIYYQHDGFARNLEREWKATLKNGRVTSSRAYRNRGYETGLDFQENARLLAAAYDPTGLGDVPDNLGLFVSFAADSSGRAVQIDKARLVVSEKGNRDSQKIEDPENPLLKEALRAFRDVTRWDAWWIDGAWRKQYFVLPLRKNGAAWTPPKLRSGYPYFGS